MTMGLNCLVSFVPLGAGEFELKEVKTQMNIYDV